MGRWKAATLANSFGTTARVEPMEPVPFSAGGPRTVHANTRVWPVKGKSVDRVWASASVQTTKHVRIEKFCGIPKNHKFSRFRELNLGGKQLYLMAMFPSPKHDPADADVVMTFGFIVDLDRTTPMG